MKHRPTEIWCLYTHYENEIPEFAVKMVNKALSIWDECDIELQELLEMCFNGDFWHARFRLLKQKEGTCHDATILWTVINNQLQFADYFELDNLDEILCVFVFYLIEGKMIQISSVSEIKLHEKLKDDCNKYGLSCVTDTNFLRQGFVLEGDYYLYNFFLDNSIGSAFSESPLTMEIFIRILSIAGYRVQRSENRVEFLLYGV